MSFSITAKGATKNELMADIVKQLDTVQASQPVHAIDRHTYIAAATSQLDLMQDPPAGIELVANMSGSMSWRDEDNGRVFIGMQMSVNIYTRHQA